MHIRSIRTAGPVGVEDTHDAHVDTILAVEAVGQGFCNALTFIVARTRTNGVYMSPAAEVLTHAQRQNGRCAD